MNYQQSKQIAKNKEKLITQLKNLRRTYLVEIYKGTVSGLSVREIHSRLWQITLMYKKRELPTDGKLYSAAKKLAKATHNLDMSGALLYFGKAKTEKLTELEQHTYKSQQIAEYWNKIEASAVMDSIVYDRAREVETKDKENALNEMVKKAKSNKKVLYLCSEHLDSADDHKHHQGKLYIDKNWRQIVDREDIDRIQALVNQRRLKTFQSIIAKPVWMVTRPNCRHYFETLTIDEVEGHSSEDLITQKKMRLFEGDRTKMQTYNHPRNKEWQTRANAQTMVEKYKDRLKTYEQMYGIQKNDFLRLAIKKTKLLIRKWKERVKELS